MKNKLFLTIALGGLFLLSSCGKDDKKCVTCTISTVSVEVCELENGNAEVNNVDTSADYDTYITGLKAAGQDCK